MVRYFKAPFMHFETMKFHEIDLRIFAAKRFSLSVAKPQIQSNPSSMYAVLEELKKNSFIQHSTGTMQFQNWEIFPA